MATILPNDSLVYQPATSGVRRWQSNMPVGSASDPDYIVSFFDFIRPTDISATDWLVVKDAGAAAAVGTDGDGGTLVLTSTATTDADGASVQSIQECFELTVGKKLWFECSAQVSDATQSAQFFGLGVAWATNPENCVASANRIGFAKLDGTTAITFDAVNTSVNSSTATGQVWVASTYKKFGFYWDGVNNVDAFIDRQYVCSAPNLASTLIGTNMAIALHSLSGDASGTKTCTIDYVMVVRER